MVGKRLDRWDRANKAELELHNKWMSGDDWVTRSEELSRLRTIQSYVRRPAVSGLTLASLAGLRVAVEFGDWRLGVAAGVVIFIPFYAYWRRSGSKYQREIARIDQGPG